MVDKKLVILLLSILLFTGCEVKNQTNTIENVLDQVVFNNNGNTTTTTTTTTTTQKTTNKTTKKVTTTKQVVVETKELSLEEQMINLINEERTKAGLKPVKYDYGLTKAANIRAAEMRDNNYFEHERPNGDKWYTVLSETGVKYSHAGENLARGFTNVNRAHTALMNSPTHKRNILMEDFRYVGIGVAKSGDTYYFVQLYKA